MVQPKIGFLSIGQSPRPEVLQDFYGVWQHQAEICEAGALDGLSQKQLQQLQPSAQESTLFAKLRDGTTINISHEKLLPYMQAKLELLQQEQAAVVVLMCTGDFHRLQSTAHLIEPNKVLRASADAALGQGKHLTLIVPIKEQQAEAKQRWEKRGYKVEVVLTQDPFADKAALLQTLSHDAKIQATDGLVADCFGFDTVFQKAVATVYPKPIFISRLLIAHLLQAIGLV